MYDFHTAHVDIGHSSTVKQDIIFQESKLGVASKLHTEYCKYSNMPVLWVLSIQSISPEHIFMILRMYMLVDEY